MLTLITLATFIFSINYLIMFVLPLGCVGGRGLFLLFMVFQGIQELLPDAINFLLVIFIRGVIRENGGVWLLINLSRRGGGGDSGGTVIIFQIFRN